MPLLKNISYLRSALATLAMTTFFLSSAQASDTMVTSKNVTESVFLIQDSEQALLTPGKITLTHPNAKVLWFANAPSTATGFKTLHQFMQLWATPQSYFTANHPNATLIGYFKIPHTHKEQRLTLVMTIQDANLAKDKKSLTYNVTKMLLVPDNKFYDNQVTLYHPTLLIDDMPAGGQSWPH